MKTLYIFIISYVTYVIKRTENVEPEFLDPIVLQSMIELHHEFRWLLKDRYQLECTSQHNDHNCHNLKYERADLAHLFNELLPTTKDLQFRL